jgi:hypothetical protein
MHKCVICWHNDDKTVVAAAICNELKKPVCEKHAAHCEDEGHGTLPLPEEDRPRLTDYDKAVLDDVLGDI